MNKNLKSGVCILLVSALVLTGFAAMVAGTLPHEVWGVAQIDASTADNGDTITAWIDGTQYEAGDVFNGDGSYQIWVPLDDTGDATIKTGGVNGDMVYFMIDNTADGRPNYVASEIATFDSGNIQELNLNFATGVQPPFHKINEIVVDPADAGNQYVYLYVPGGAVLADWRLETHDGVIGTLDTLTVIAHPSDADLVYVDIGVSPLGTTAGHLMLSWQSGSGVAGDNWIALDRVEYGDQAGSPGNTIHPEYPTAPGSGEGLVRVTKGVDTDDSSVDFTIATETGRPVTLTTQSTVGGAVTTPGEDTYDYLQYEVVDIVATPDVDYSFVEWTGDIGTIADPSLATTTITMNGDYTITANFVEDAPVLLPDITGIYVVESGADIVVNWDDVGADDYNVYHSADVYAAMPWTLAGTVATNTFTHVGGLGGANFYYVRATDGVDEGNMSSIAYCVERVFVDDADQNLHYLSIPARFNNLETITASDIVTAIEGGTGAGTNVYIYRVVRWDYTVRGFTQIYDYRTFPAGWGGTNFAINPGDAVGIFIQADADFSWHICGVDTEFSLSFVDDADFDLHYISLPYTFFDYNADGQITAADIVTAIEGGTGAGTNVYIYRVVRWDYTVRGFTQIYDYRTFPAGWGGTNFVVNPGDAVGIFIQADADFVWNMELVAPYQG